MQQLQSDLVLQFEDEKDEIQRMNLIYGQLHSWSAHPAPLYIINIAIGIAFIIDPILFVLHIHGKFILPK